MSAAEARPSNILAPSPVSVDRGRRALVSLAATNGVPGAGEEDTGDEDNCSVVHVVEGDGKSGRHAEERDGEADPHCDLDVSTLHSGSMMGRNTYSKR